MNSGILLVAHGRPSYWDEAATLARSLRRHSPQVAIAIASDINVPEKRWRRDGFDLYVPYDFRNCGGVSFKMQLDRITPFQDATLFIDSDSICYGDISSVFSAFPQSDFVALGEPADECHWFEDTAFIRRHFACDTFPFFCGDFYLFRASSAAAAVFSTARDIAHNFRALGIKPLGNWCNDEPAFSLAMTCHGLQAQTGVGEWILQVVHSGLTGLRLNYCIDSSQACLDGVAVHPRIVHFSAHRSKPIYFRERYRVFNSSSGLVNICLAHAQGLFGSMMFRVEKRLKSHLQFW